MELPTLSPNKSIILNFYRRTVGQGDLDFAEQVVADDYIQHSPGLKPGKAGLMEALAFMKQMPKPSNPAKSFLRLIEEGDYVVTNLCFEWGGRQTAVVDIFQFRDGKIAEHWDAVQACPERSLNGNAMMDGSTVPEDISLTIANKKVVQAFYQQFFVDQQWESLSNYLNPDLIQHHPEIASGVTGLVAYLQQNGERLSARKMHRIIGEGNFVVIQAEGKMDGMPLVFYDIYRLHQGRIVEQWSVSQSVPDPMPHPHGML
jgi:predicted SnoaL-like aldol condensation-catalyzing enzyme